MTHSTPSGSGQGQSVRLFLALWPDTAACAQIARVQQAWIWSQQARCYAPRDWHVTLHFIGSVPAQRLPELEAGLRMDNMSPCDLVLDQTALWPRGLAVCVATVTPPALRDLHARLGQTLRALGLPVENRPWKPHLTLARNARHAVSPAAIDPICLHASHYVLVVSTGESEQRYKILVRYSY